MRCSRLFSCTIPKTSDACAELTNWYSYCPHFKEVAVFPSVQSQKGSNYRLTGIAPWLSLQEELLAHCMDQRWITTSSRNDEILTSSLWDSDVIIMRFYFVIKWSFLIATRCDVIIMRSFLIITKSYLAIMKLESRNYEIRPLIFFNPVNAICLYKCTLWTYIHMIYGIILKSQPYTLWLCMADFCSTIEERQEKCNGKRLFMWRQKLTLIPSQENSARPC